ncbi:MAG: 5'-nucleotidase C-terminal domain-containing protein, partial [Prevotellaceae bacterium]|nr:5'-nucleotidase C-terminal domain-containing protein [Prevotellaceae bacterium]
MKNIRKFYHCILVLCFVCSSVTAQERKDTVTILSFNDFHGAFAEDSSSNIPGAAIFSQALLDVKQANRNSVIVSVGDNFSGSYFAKVTGGSPIRGMLDIDSVKLSAVGNHEFDWNTEFLLEMVKKSIPHVAANIHDSTKAFNDVISPYKIITIPVNGKPDFKIAFIGLTTTETGEKTNREYIRNLRFDAPDKNLVDSLINNTSEIGNADMKVLLMHIGTEMKDGNPVIMEKNAQDLSSANNITAIISGHSHNVVLGKINNIPVIQAGTNGRYIGKLQFEITVNNSKISAINYIKGDTIKVSGSKANKTVEYGVRFYTKINGLDSVYVQSTEALIHDRTKNFKTYTQVGALVTASYAAKYRAALPIDERFVIGVNQFNGIRQGLPLGDITKLQAGNALPFGGNLRAYRFTGATLKKLLSSGRTNKNGYLQTSNAILYIDNDTTVIRVLSSEGIEVQDTDECVVVCDAFLAGGGDGYDSKLFQGNIIACFGSSYNATDVFLDYLKGQETIPNTNSQVPVVCDGSEENPYQIFNANDLVYFRDHINQGKFGGKYFKQIKDIDFLWDIKNWIPIGTMEHPFSGHYDGSRCLISNLIVNNDNLAGLFGRMSGGSIKKVRIGPNSSIAGRRAGAVCAYIYKGGTIEDCQNNAPVEGSENAGGICGYSYGGRIIHCVNRGRIWSTGLSSLSGGIAGASAFEGALICSSLNYGIFNAFGNKNSKTGG